ncbi:WD40 repeat domain-containing protein [Streptomyces sp. NPDC051940]|uniref:WD40 repeat domain-containing protein n=1 Tax=Streptomyces sp. NPDC051940 TaxID=3155675 RepID=UPI00341E2DCC
MAAESSAALDVGALLTSDLLITDRKIAGHARRALLSPEQPALVYLQKRVAAEDVEVLFTLRDEETDVHRLLAPRGAAASHVRALGDLSPHGVDEPAAAQALRASAAMALALVGDVEDAPRQLRTGLLWLRHCQAHLPLDGLETAGLLGQAAPGHAARIRRLLAGLGEEERDLALPVLLWLLTLDGALPEPRKVAEAGVLFDTRRGHGASGTLTVAVVPDGPPALIPDPRTMSGFRADARFQQSLRDAWTAAGHRVTGTVLWSLTNAEGVVGAVADRSLGCAFGVLIKEAGRRTRTHPRLSGELNPGARPLQRLRARFSLPAIRRLNSRTALVGALDGTPAGRLVTVGGYAGKLKAAHNGQNVIIPGADEVDARHEWKGDKSAKLLPASTIGEAARLARTWDGPALARWAKVTGPALLVVLAVVGGMAYSFAKAGDEEADKALAADLAAQAMTLRQTDPRLAGLLGLAGSRIRPDTPRAVQAMRDVLDANSGVRRSWQASPTRVDGVAVDDKRDRVYTTGDDSGVKSWDLRTGEFLGKAPGEVSGLVLSDVSGLLAARDARVVSLYEVLDEKPVLLGTLPVPTCARADSETVATAFTDRGVRLVEVRDDGTMAQYDTTTRQQTDCRRLDAMDVPGLPGGLRVVVDASVALSPAPRADQEPAEERVVVLLTNNRVLSVGLDSHKVAVEIEENDVQDVPSHIGANDELIVLATPGGVQAWDRVRRRQLSFPVGALAMAPRAMVEHSGSVAIAGDAGTALVPLGTGYDAAASRGLDQPRGGPATAVAVGDEFTVVAAGRGGRVNILDDKPGPLGRSTAPATSAAAFAGDGRLLLTAFSDLGNASDGLYTVRPEAAENPSSPIARDWPHETDYPSRAFFVNDVATSPEFVAGAGQFNGRGTIVLWRPDGTWLRDLRPSGVDETGRPSDERIVIDVEFLPKAHLLIARHVTGPVTVWSTQTWKELDTVPLAEGISLRVHGSRAVVLERPGEDGARVVTIDLTTPRNAHTRAVKAPGAYRLDWSYDGSRLALLSEGNVVRYLDAELRDTGSPLRLPEAATVPTTVALSPDARRTAVAFADQVLVYDTATGLQSMPALRRVGAGDIIHLSWSPNDHRLAAVTRSFRTDNAAGPLNLWQVGGIDWRRSICQWTDGKGLTREEWARHIGDRHPYIDLCAEEK